MNCHAGSVGLKWVYNVLYLYKMYTYVSNQVRVCIYIYTRIYNICLDMFRYVYHRIVYILYIIYTNK